MMKASVFALTALLAGAAYAQTEPATANGGAAGMHQQMLNNLATLLDLTATQKTQVDTVLQEEHAKMKESFEEAKASGTKPDWQAMKTLHQQIEQDTITKLTPVLSALQLKKFEVLQSMHHHGRHHGGPPPASTTAPQS
jgi:hypothetical protein